MLLKSILLPCREQPVLSVIHSRLLASSLPFLAHVCAICPALPSLLLCHRLFHAVQAGPASPVQAARGIASAVYQGTQRVSLQTHPAGPQLAKIQQQRNPDCFADTAGPSEVSGLNSSYLSAITLVQEMHYPVQFFSRVNRDMNFPPNLDPVEAKLSPLFKV